MYTLDLFAGPGGWDVAARDLGIHPVGVEWDKWARETRKAAGLATHPLYDDVRRLQVFPRSIDLLIASPPCQTFSMAGNGAGRKALNTVIQRAVKVALGEDLDYSDFDDERTGLVLEPLRIIRDARPRYVALEQVPTVLPVWDEFGSLISELFGYYVATGILHAEQFGVPQTRKRAILVASLDGPVSPPKPTHRKYKKGVAQHEGDPDLKPWVSMAEALGWGFDVRPSPTVTGGATPFANAALRRELQFAGAGRTAVDTAGQVRRTLDEPAHTITAGHDSADRHWAPGSVRVTVQEAGILQSFSADYPWQGPKTKQYQQVGNAIPPLLAKAVLSSVIQSTTDRKESQ